MFSPSARDFAGARRAMLHVLRFVALDGKRDVERLQHKVRAHSSLHANMTII
jgi:hypothetical protein